MPHRDLARVKMFNRRVALLAGGKFVLFSALVGRLYYLQVVESDRYVTLADDNRINLRLLPPPRGRILDRRGEHLATNRLNYRVVMISEQTPSVEATLEALGKLIPISAGAHRKVLRESRRKRGFVPITVRADLSWDEVARVGRLYKVIGRIRPAEKMFARAVQIRPDCVDALRELRLINMRREKNRSLLSRFFPFRGRDEG